MAAAPEISMRASADRSSVTIQRGDSVPDVFWLRAVAEWGTSGSRAGHEISTPVERFLSHISWVKPACILHGVSIDLDDATRDLITKSGRERSALSQAIERPNASADVDTRLAGSRFKRELRTFQRRDLARLLALHSGANFSVPGAGKTTVTYALYEAEHRAGRVARLLVVAPLSAFGAWEDELEECFVSPLPILQQYNGGRIRPKAEIVVVNYQRLASDYRTLSRWASEAPTHVVFDEAHRAKKGWAGEWGRACLSLAFLASRRDILTGTPAPQGFKDLEALLDVVWPGQARVILPLEIFSRGQGPGAAESVATAIAPLFVRTTKSDLRLPDVNFAVKPIPLQGLQAQIYAALKDEYAGELALTRRDRVDLARMGQVVMYLLEAACNPQLLTTGSSEFDPPEFRHPPVEVPPGTRLRELLAQYALYETPSKFVALAELIKANVELGRKTLVWTNFVKNISALERVLARYKPAAVHGGVPSRVSNPRAPRTREDEVSRFRDPESGCMVLLANPAAMSEGISLHLECHDAVYLDRTFNAGQYLQSLDRIHRLGLAEKEETRVTFLLTQGTIDETVNSRIRDKADRLGRILNDRAIEQMALPDDEDYGAPFDTAADIIALFAHLRGDAGTG